VSPENWINLVILIVGLFGGILGGWVAAQVRLARLEFRADSAKERIVDLEKLPSRVGRLEGNMDSMSEKMADFKQSLKEALTELRELRDLIR
jgi:predicted  nucleic acid-binding Zn-ribbon protein